MAKPADGASDESLADLAAAWLAAERNAVEKCNEARAERLARDTAAAYEKALRAASPEELLLAWESARRTQAAQEMGSQDWLEARSVSELLRTEYTASRALG